MAAFLTWRRAAQAVGLYRLTRASSEPNARISVRVSCAPACCERCGESSAAEGSEAGYNNGEPDYRPSGSSGLSVSERSLTPGAFVATSDPIELATEIMAAYVANNAVPRADLPALFEGLHAALKRLEERGKVALVDIVKPSPRCRSANPSRQII